MNLQMSDHEAHIFRIAVNATIIRKYQARPCQGETISSTTEDTEPGVFTIRMSFSRTMIPGSVEIRILFAVSGFPS